MDPLAGLLIIAGLLAGIALGWFLGTRGNADRASLDERLRTAETALAGSEERAATAALLRTTLDGVRDERDEALRTIAADRAAMREREAAWEAERKRVAEDQEAHLVRFNDLAGKVLTEAQATFLKRADERFNQAGEKSEQQLKALLQPVGETLKRYEEGLATVEKARVGAYGELKTAVASLAQGNDLVRQEAARLTNVMRSSPKARGRWGEEQLRTILESAGLAENVDFQLQTSVDDGEKQLRPDCIINLPGGRCIVIDVKCPLVAFEQAFDEEDEGRRAGFLLDHARAMKSYASDLGRKGYWRQFDRSPDFVIMFIPGEHFLSAASERAPDLIETAFRNGVIIASTINMLALAKFMAGMWREQQLAEEAQRIGALGKELYARLQKMGSHVHRLGQNLARANGAYNDFVGSLESQVLTQAQRFESMKVDTAGKTIEPVPLIETGVRPLTKLAIEPVEVDVAQ